MSLRTHLLGLSGALALAGSIAAKPPGLPIEPLPAAHEPTPVAREFHDPSEPVIILTAFRINGSERLSDLNRAGEPIRLTSFVTGLRDYVLDRLTLPLGTPEPRE